MDQEKIKAMADAAAAGYEVQFDSDEEARAVESMLQAKHGVSPGRAADPIDLNAPQKTNAGPNLQANSFLAGAKPGIADYAPALGVVKDAATGSKDATGSGFSNMSPEEKEYFIASVDQLPESMKSMVLKEMFKLNYKRGIEQNKSDRASAQAADPVGYGMGQATSGALLGAGAGVVAGPGAAAQGLAGMASGFAMDPHPSSALAGGIGGAASTAVPKSFASGIRKSGTALAESDITDDMIADWLNMDSNERIAAKSGGLHPQMDEIADVVRANASGGGGPQATREAIELPAIQRGAEGTSQNPMGKYPRPVDLEAQISTPAKPKESWLNPSGRSTQVDLDWPTSNPSNIEDAELLTHHGLDSPMYENTSTQELADIAPPHPAADRLLAPKGKPIGPYGRPAPEPNSIQGFETGPDQPPLSPPERYVSDKLGAVNDKGLDLVHQTPTGAVSRLIANRLAPAIGITAPALGQKMLQMLESKGNGMIVGGLEGAGASKLRAAVQDVIGSDDPDVMDYMYQEMYPQYRALALEAKNALEKEAK